MLEKIFFLTLAVTFTIQFLNVSGLRDKGQLYAPNAFIHSLIGCDFCLAFWLSVVFTAAEVWVSGDWLGLCFPILSTPLIRKLL